MNEVEITDCPGGICPVPWAKKEEDNVNHPAHYTEGGVEYIEAIEAQLTPEEYRGGAGTKKDAGPKESMKDKMARLRSMQKKNKKKA